MDSIDENLVRLLAKDARQSNETLAKKLNISAATVRRRLKKLNERDMIRFVAIVDPEDFGFPLAVVIAFDVVQDRLNEVLDALMEYPEIRWISTTTGRFDIISIGRFRSNKDLSDFMTGYLGPLQGINKIETFVCLNMKKARYHQLP
jgi:Lrp/AsnC family transcriptional regulator for asnA, asnC and gidA